MHFGIVGTQSQRGPIGGERSRRVANATVRRAETVVVVRLLWVCGERSDQQVDRRLMAAVLQREHSQHEEHVRVLGVAAEGGPLALANGLPHRGARRRRADEQHLRRIPHVDHPGNGHLFEDVMSTRREDFTIGSNR